MVQEYKDTDKYVPKGFRDLLDEGDSVKKALTEAFEKNPDDFDLVFDPQWLMGYLQQYGSYNTFAEFHHDGGMMHKDAVNLRAMMTYKGSNILSSDMPVRPYDLYLKQRAKFLNEDRVNFEEEAEYILPRPNPLTTTPDEYAVKWREYEAQQRKIRAAVQEITPEGDIVVSNDKAEKAPPPVDAVSYHPPIYKWEKEGWPTLTLDERYFEAITYNKNTVVSLLSGLQDRDDLDGWRLACALVQRFHNGTVAVAQLSYELRRLMGPSSHTMAEGAERMYRDGLIDVAQSKNDDSINHPSHYTQYSGVEVIEITEKLSFNRGNAVKYICRAGFKSQDTEIQDLEKALWYTERAIAHEDEFITVLLPFEKVQKLVEQMNYNRGTAVWLLSLAGRIGAQDYLDDLTGFHNDLNEAKHSIISEIERLKRYSDEA